jgi:hypothetical protein
MGTAGVAPHLADEKWQVEYMKLEDGSRIPSGPEGLSPSLSPDNQWILTESDHEIMLWSAEGSDRRSLGEAADRSANTTPGNKRGGLSNIVEKALGSIAKSGTSPISDVLAPGERVRRKGLVFAATPASDFICGTLQLAAGMTLQVFTTGRGTPEHGGVMGRVDVLTGTLGKALGGASGGYTSGRKEIIELLRQRSRPYLFSNTLCPAIAGASLKVLEMLSQSTALRDRLAENTRFFREGLSKIGLTVLAGEHPIVPIMLGEAALAARVLETTAAYPGPVLVVYGTADQTVPPAVAGRYGELFGGRARLVQLPGAGHTFETAAFREELYRHSLEFIVHGGQP